MKIIAIFCLLLTAAQTAKSQVSGQTVYTIKAKELWQRPNGSSDTIDVPVLNFIAKLDSTGNAADSVLISVKKIVSGNTDTLAGLVAGKELTLASNIPLTMEFILARLVPQNETIKKPKMKLYFGVNDSFKMILSEKVAEEMIALNKAGTPASRFEAKDDSLITSVHTIRVTDKTIRVVFLHLGELQTDAQKQNEEVKSLLKKLLAGSGSRQAIGWFTLRKNPVQVYEAIGKSSKPYSKGPFPIQSVDIMLKTVP